MFAILHDQLINCRIKLELSILEKRAIIKRSKKWKVMKLDPAVTDALNEEEFELDEVNTLINRYKRFL